jgi:hypothetical protein
MDLIEPFGDFPPKLFRCFAEEKHARAFVDVGYLRFRPVTYFASLEDAIRADSSEGKAHLQVPGDVTTVRFDDKGNVVGVTEEPGYINFQSEFINPVFVYCFSYPPGGDITLLPAKFGRFVVQVDEPLQLARDLTVRMTEDGVLRRTPVVECHRVVYNKGEKSQQVEDHFQRTRLNFMQKPSSFADEYEYRLASVDCRGVGNRETTQGFYDVIVGRALPYASMFERPI